MPWRGFGNRGGSRVGLYNENIKQEEERQQITTAMAIYEV
jgi:hypothetical protein